MEYTIIEKGPMLVMGIALRTNNQDGKAAREIGPFWQGFYEKNIQGRISNQKTGEVLGLYCDYESDYMGPYTLVAGCEVVVAADIPSGLVLKHIPSAKYAVFSIKGSFPKALVDTWGWIWEGHLDRAYSADFEIYPLGFHPTENPEILLYVSIK